MTLSANDLHYLRIILDRMRELRSAAEHSKIYPTFRGEAFNDEIDWLDCFIDKHSKRKRKA